jgi:hypothetical protein
MRTILPLLCLCLVATTAVAAPKTHQRRVLTEGQMIVLKLPVGQAVFLTMPEPISSVNTVLPASRLMIGEDSPHLTFGLLDPTLTEGRLSVVGTSGVQYVVYFEPAADPAKGDVEVVVTRGAPAPPSKRFDAFALLRALRQPGPPAVPGVQPVPPALPTILDPRVVLSTPEMFTVQQLKGLRVAVVNTQDTPLTLHWHVGEPLSLPVPADTVPLGQWVWPSQYQIAVLTVEQATVPAHGQTTLYLVYEER